MADDVKKKSSGKTAAKPDEAAAASEAPTPKKKKSKRRTVQEGKVYIHASFNNTIVTFTDLQGNTLAWSSSGSSGFKGSKKSTPYAAQVAAENAGTKAKVYGVEKISVYIKGVGPGREQSLRGLNAAGFQIQEIKDITPIAHNGCRKRKARRV